MKLRAAAAAVAMAGCGAVLQELVAAAATLGRALTSPSAAAGRRDETAGWHVHGAPELGTLRTDTGAEAFALLVWGERVWCGSWPGDGRIRVWGRAQLGAEGAAQRNYLSQTSHSLLMPAHDERAWHTHRTIPPDPSLLHLSMCCLWRTLRLSLTWKNIASPTAPLQIQHFLNFVTNSIEVCQRLGTRSVIKWMNIWIEAVSCTIVKICPSSHPF